MTADSPQADDHVVIGHLLPGAANFAVEELPAYEPCGEGEHAYCWIEKRDLTTDQAAGLLAQAAGRGPRDVGFAGRKDRRGVTRQWISIHFGDLAALEDLTCEEGDGILRVLRATRHRNKLKPGHLRGNRFRLGLRVEDPAALAAGCARIANEGLPNRFGDQRFGLHRVSLRVARHWARGELERAVELLVDPDDRWRVGQDLPRGFRRDPSGKLLGALRKGAAPDKALRAAGQPLRRLVANAAQAAIFNAVHDARRTLGIAHRLRAGDLAQLRSGAPFVVAAEDLADANRRAEQLEVFTTGPLPGTWRLLPSPEIVAEEQSWSASTGIEWDWFAKGGTFEAPGTRRPLVVPLLEAPELHPADDHTWLAVALPSGSYATELLHELGITVPHDRSGRGHPSPDQ